MDLNLLTALDALLEENSVQAAANRLQLSAPAMSRTLSRIRNATGDDILVRTGRTMTPTPRALELRDEVRELVARATEVLGAPRDLDHGSLRRIFTIRAAAGPGDDGLVGAVVPALARTAAAEAPGVSLRIVTEPDSTDQVRDHIDLDLGSTIPLAPQISHDNLGQDRWVVVMRAGHPLADQLDVSSYADARHLVVASRGNLSDGVDKLLTDAGLSRRVVATVPTIGLALRVLATSDLVCLLADRTTAAARADHNIIHREPPLALPPLPVVMSWHSRYDTDPAHAWLRQCCREILRRTLADPSDRDAA